MLNIKIKYFDNARELVINEKGDWIDLYANKDMFIPEGSRAMIPLGVGMILPEGYEAHVVPRSSTFKTWGLIQTNHMGIIDNSYSGDNDQWHMPVYCLLGQKTNNDGVKGTYVCKGDKICQFRIVEIMGKVNLERVEHLNSVDRGGFGSTGTK